MLINGHNILEEPEAAKSDIGYLPEIPPLYTDMTVREYLDFAASLKNPRASRARLWRRPWSESRSQINGQLIKTSKRLLAAGWHGLRPFRKAPGDHSWMNPPWAWTLNRSSRSGI